MSFFLDTLVNMLITFFVYILIILYTLPFDVSRKKCPLNWTVSSKIKIPKNVFQLPETFGHFTQIDSNIPCVYTYILPR